LKRKVLLCICLFILLTGLTVGGVLLFRRDHETERIIHDFEIPVRELRPVRERQNSMPIPSNSVVRFSLPDDLLFQISELGNYREAFFNAYSRENKVIYFREFDSLFSIFQSEHDKTYSLTILAIVFEETENAMYSWFVEDYYDIYNQIRFYADTTTAISQGGATELIDKLRALQVLINSEGVLSDSDNERITENVNILFSDIVGLVDRQPPLISWSRKNTGEILIEGDRLFVRRIEEALDIIRLHPDYYELVTTYVDKIRPGRIHGDYSSYIDVIGIPADTVHSDVLVYGPTVGMGADHMQRSPVFIAGVIVHEAYHSKLFHEHKNYNTAPTTQRWHTDADNFFYWPESDLWATGLGHMETWEVHSDFLMEAGASRSELDWAQRTMTRVWGRYPQLRGTERHRRFRTAPEVPLYRELVLWE